MNTDTDSDSGTNSPQSADERVMDALLAEHVRLGTQSDVELVDTILSKTVQAPVINVSTMPKVVAKKPAGLGKSDWLKLVAAVAAIACLGVLMLNSFKTKPTTVVTTERKEDVFHVVVLSSAGVTDQSQQSFKRKVELSPLVNSDIQLPEGSGAAYELEIIEVASTSVDEFTSDEAFRASIDFQSLEKVARPSFTVAGNTNEKVDGKVIYSGHAILKHKTFIIEADSIVMEVGSGDASLVKALNAKVSHFDGRYQCVSDAIAFNPNTGEMVVRGASSLTQNGVQRTIENESVLYIKGAKVKLVELLASPE